MTEVRVGTRELKSKLSEYLRPVKNGRTIIVAERGTVLIPPQPLTIISVALAEGARQRG